MRKAMLSQPMAGKTHEEIVETRERTIHALRERGYEIVNTLFTDEWYGREAMEARGVVQIPLCFLAKSLENMSLCHAAYFCKLTAFIGGFIFSQTVKYFYVVPS